MIFLLPFCDLMLMIFYCSLGTGGREKEMIKKKTLSKNPGFLLDFQFSFTGLGEATQRNCAI